LNEIFQEVVINSAAAAGTKEGDAPDSHMCMNGCGINIEKEIS
jgi:hypothetical protein